MGGLIFIAMERCVVCNVLFKSRAGSGGQNRLYCAECKEERYRTYRRESYRQKSGYYLKRTERNPNGLSDEEFKKMRWKKWHRESYLRRKESGAVKRTREKYHSIPQNRIARNLRNKIWCCLNRGKVSAPKMFGFVEVMGCTSLELKVHLESQFTEGMSWDNYGVNGWHIDHVIPCASFDLTDPIQQKTCFHFSNLRPMWARENIKKGKKIL